MLNKRGGSRSPNIKPKIYIRPLVIWTQKRSEVKSSMLFLSYIEYILNI